MLCEMNNIILNSLTFLSSVFDNVPGAIHYEYLTNISVLSCCRRRYSKGGTQFVKSFALTTGATFICSDLEKDSKLNNSFIVSVVA